MAEKRRFLDVWLVEPNTVYREVPFSVVADWVMESRLLADDMLRPSGTRDWFRVGASPDFSPYIPKPTPFQAEDEAEALSPVEFDFAWKRRPEDDDDDVDMIPLIDVSLVLLIFFIMTAGEVIDNYRLPSARKMLVDFDKNLVWVAAECENDASGKPDPERIRFSFGWVDRPSGAVVKRDIKLGEGNNQFDELIRELRIELLAERERESRGESSHVFPVPLTVRAEGPVDATIVRGLLAKLTIELTGGKDEKGNEKPKLLKQDMYYSVKLRK